MTKPLRIGTRDSQLAVWQATLVQNELSRKGITSELVYIKSDGDIDLVTPLYELGVQGIFTKTLDAALLNDRIDIAVHSMKDVPTQLAKGLQQSAVLPRASFKDILVYKGDKEHLLETLGFVNGEWSVVSEDTRPSFHDSVLTIATSSVRRKAQWLNRYPNHVLDNLRGNVNTRMRKLEESNWNGAIFAGAGLERIGLRPSNSIDLDWMLPAPSQGAIMIACRENDPQTFEATHQLNDTATAICTKIEKDFLRVLMGGCTTPISALAIIQGNTVHFRGNVLSLDGKQKAEIEKIVPVSETVALGEQAAEEVLQKGGAAIIESIRNA
ncbi:MAG: hydroxymethylbilane synthase [Bacteroidota bacterium]|nr:hydroxymethylbilane synthase [Bacteroidota bacterium]